MDIVKNSKEEKEMTEWDLNVLYYGKITAPAQFLLAGLDEGFITNPYLGFLVQHKDRCILVDCGINDRFIKDGKAWGGFPAEAGRSYVERALEKCGVAPDQIEMVIYTHLHNDHAGNCDLFPKAKHVFQRDEWFNLLDPVPVQRARGDYDLEVAPILAKFDTIKINGDVEVLPGIKLYKALGHSLGSQLVTVNTVKGTMVIIGDLCMTYCHMFPERDYLIDMDGVRRPVKTNTALYGPAIPSAILYDYFDWYDSVYKAKALAQGKQEYVLPGHETELITDFRKA
jgi:glyoxylase-like metal-dependent hydrolase (beta-lactamase superfamily II)